MDDTSIAMNSILLRTMPKSSAKTLVAGAKPVAIKSGKVVFHEGDPARYVYIVLAGLLKLYRIDTSGNEAIVAIQRPGNCIATALAFGDNRYPVACAALEDSRYLAIKCDAIRETLMGSQDTIGAVLATTYAHLHELVDQVAQLKASSTQKRVARFLMALCDQPHGQAQFQLPYDKVVIAGVLGMTPETLSRVFGKLKEHGVRVDGKNVNILRVETVVRFLENS